MSFAKRCGVAIATRWTLVIFAACKEAMALGEALAGKAMAKKQYFGMENLPVLPGKLTWIPKSGSFGSDDFPL